MYITRVCKLCDNNKFHVIPEGLKFNIQCSECSSLRDSIKVSGEMIIPKCKFCGSDKFKIREKEVEDDIAVKINCSECGEAAEYTYIDDEGNEITFEKRTLLDVRKLVEEISDKIGGLELEVGYLRERYNEFNYEVSDITNLGYELEGITKELSDIKDDIDSLNTKVSKFNY